jgi:uroporphyrinogen decarboxylase
MTHRQRLDSSLNHEEPDIVPIDFATGGNTSPVPEIYAKLLAHYPEVDDRLELIPHMLRLAAVDEVVLEDLDIDTRSISMKPIEGKSRINVSPGVVCDDWGVLWKEVDIGGAVYRELSESPLREASLEDLDRYPWWPDPQDPERYLGVSEHAMRLFDTTDFGLVGCPAFNGVWERATYLCGFERMLAGLLLEKEFIHALLRKITEITKASLAIFLDLVGDNIQVIKMADDLGTQNGPQMSPAAYREMIQPYHRELFTLIKQKTKAKIFLHACGSVFDLLPDLIEAGVDILNPVQVSAKNMDSRQLKREFGKELSFWGAIDTQHILPHGSVEDVKREVQQRIEDLGPGGGYILAPVHNVQADVPVENLITMYRHAREVGKYPIGSHRR